MIYLSSIRYDASLRSVISPDIFQGYYIQDLLSERSFQQSYMWDHPNPPNLVLQHCYGLPARDLSLKQMAQNPIRLRRIEIPTTATGITAICAGGSTLGLRVHSGSSLELDIYERVEGLSLSEQITWLFCPLREGEVIVEIDVRGLPKADHSALWFPSLTVCTIPPL